MIGSGKNQTQSTSGASNPPGGVGNNPRKSRKWLFILLAISIIINLTFISYPFVEYLVHFKKFRDSEARLSKKVGSPPTVGAWGQSRIPGKGAHLSERQAEEIRKLKSIGYLAGVNTAQETSGVTRHLETKTFQGFNLFSSGHGPEAILMDMEGKILHKWAKSYLEVWPKRSEEHQAEKNFNSQFWRRCRLFENGDLLVIFEGLGLFKLDKDSNLLWKYDAFAHHDLDIDPQGNIFVLIREGNLRPEYNSEQPILEDFIAVLDPGGNEIRRISLLKCLANSPYWSAVDNENISGDVFHTNTLQWLDGELIGLSEIFQKGNVLVSLCNRDFIGIVDLEKETFVWGLSGLFIKQHQPELAPDGSIMVFDNRGLGKRSRVMRFTPFQQRILWVYDGKADGDFYSRKLGSFQQLPNGNVLITESEFGRVIEVAASKQIVWEYISPYRAGKDNEWVAQIPEMLRIEPDYTKGWLK
jgi:Arylsulfotransferase (ASST)